jgi:hypothetical protein
MFLILVLDFLMRHFLHFLLQIFFKKKVKCIKLPRNFDDLGGEIFIPYPRFGKDILCIIV